MRVGSSGDIRDIHRGSLADVVVRHFAVSLFADNKPSLG